MVIVSPHHEQEIQALRSMPGLSPIIAFDLQIRIPVMIMQHRRPLALSLHSLLYSLA